MDEKRFETILRGWAEREERAAPALRPPDALRRRVRDGGASRRLPSPPLVRALAAAACVLLLVSLVFLCPSPTEEGRIVLLAWEEGESALVDGPRLQGPEKGGSKGSEKGGAKGGAKGSGKGGEKGGGEGEPFFRQLLFQVRPRGGETIVSTDVMRRGAGKVIVLGAGDGYRIGLIPAVRGNVAVFQLNGSGRGEAVRLFPNRAYSSRENPLVAGAPLTIPAGTGWLSLKSDRGGEAIYIVGSRQPLSELGRMYDRYRSSDGVAARERAFQDLRKGLDALGEDPWCTHRRLIPRRR